jgi:hypothetical protein
MHTRELDRLATAMLPIDEVTGASVTMSALASAMLMTFSAPARSRLQDPISAIRTKKQKQISPAGPIWKTA